MCMASVGACVGAVSDGAVSGGAGSADIGIEPWSIFEWSIGGSTLGLVGEAAVVGRLAGCFFATAFLAAGFFLAGAGIGILIPPWPACCARAGTGAHASAMAPAANS